MIEVTKASNKKKRVIKYPCLMIGCSGSIVAMTSEGVGTLLSIANGAGTKELYQSSAGWLMSDFILYDGSITLTNKSWRKELTLQ